MKPILTAAILVVAAPGTGAEGPSLVSQPLPMLGDKEVFFNDADVHHYSVDLEPGEFLLVKVTQKGVDVALELHTSDGRKVLAFDRPGGAYVTERLGFVAAQRGRYQVVVRATSTLRTRRYSIRAEKTRAKRRENAYAQACLDELEAARLGEGDRPSVDRALFLYRKTQGVWRKLGETVDEVFTIYRAAQLWQELNRRKEALRQFGRALARMDTSVDRSSAGALALRADLLLRLGRLHRQLADPAKAWQAYQEALHLTRRAGDRSLEATILNSLALLAKQMSDFEIALDLYDRAAEAYREVDRPKDLFTVLRNRGLLQIVLGRFGEAEHIFREALELSAALGNTVKEMQVWSDLGWVYFFSDETQRALDVYQTVLDHAEILRKPDLALTRDRQGQAYRKLGRWDEANASYMMALEVYEELGLPVLQEIVRLNLGELLLARGEVEESIVVVEQAISIFRKANEHDILTAALIVLARAERQAGRLESARTIIEEAVDNVESLRLGTSDPTLRLSIAAPRQNAYEMQIDLLMELARKGSKADLEEALITTEKTRARELLGRLRRRSSAQRYEDSLSRVPGRDPQYEPLGPSVPADLRKIQHKTLDSETALLIYYLGTDRSFLWHVSTDHLFSYELPPRDVIEPLVREYYVLLEKSYRGEVAGQLTLHAARLGQMLLGRAYGHLRGKRLAVVADGALQYLPFAALRVPTPESDVLALHHEIVMSPSISVLDALRTESARPPERWTVAVLADPVFDPRDERLDLSSQTVSLPQPSDQAPIWPRLPYTQLEADAILAQVPEKRRYQALGLDANRETVLSRRLRRHDVVHFATHGFLDTEQPEMSGIVLSLVDEKGRPTPEGFLRLQDIYQLDLPVELVVLSACRTGLGKEIRGEGLIGLTRGFLYAGAQRLLVSLWDVSDHATARLMKAFYHAVLVEGQSPAKALRIAQMSMLDDPRFAAPYYWAAFVLHGDWR